MIVDVASIQRWFLLFIFVAFDVASNRGRLIFQGGFYSEKCGSYIKRLKVCLAQQRLLERYV